MTALSDIDRLFQALGDPTRRAILDRLRRNEATIGALAAPFEVSVPAISKHVSVLERAGLVARTRDGREMRVRLIARPMREASNWMARYRAFWDERLDALEAALDEPDR